jgi:hypothetical protein
MGELVRKSATGMLVAALVLMVGASVSSATEPEDIVPLESPADDTIPSLPGTNSRSGDCGWSVPLHDGKVMWIGCDPINMGLGLSNTAGIAPASDPDAVTLQTSQLIPPPAGTCPDAPGHAYHRFVHPQSATGVISATTTRVVMIFNTGCWHTDLEELEEAANRDWTSGIAELTYDPANPTTPLTATVLSYDMWPSEWSDGTLNEPYLSIHYAQDDGFYAYACDVERWIGSSDDGRCTVARAATTANLADHASWSYWNGTTSTWIDTTCIAACTETDRRTADQQATAITVPTDPAESDPSGTQAPVIWTMAWDDELDLFVQSQLQHHWTRNAWIRFSDNPVGPWTSPIQVPLACDGGVACYHIAPHPELLAGSLAFHYYDRAHDATPNDWRFFSVPLCELDTAAAFSDVSGNHPFATEINERADACVVRGYANGTFNPSGTITRQAMLTFLWRHDGFDPMGEDTGTPEFGFTDVGASSPFRHQIQWARYSTGLTGVFTTGQTITPNEPVTREQAARLLYRLSGATYTPPATSPFSDVATSRASYAAIMWGVSEGIICGDAPVNGVRTFRPTASVTRQAAAAFLYRDDGHPTTCT